MAFLRFSAADDVAWGHTPRVFLSKSAEVIENKRREPEKEAQESLRVRNRKEKKEIEVEEVASSRRFVRDGECIGVGRRSAMGKLGGDFLFFRLRLSLVALASGSPRSRANRARRAALIFTGYDTAWGTPRQLVGWTVGVQWTSQEGLQRVGSDFRHVTFWFPSGMSKS